MARKCVLLVNGDDDVVLVEEVELLSPLLDGLVDVVIAASGRRGRQRSPSNFAEPERDPRRSFRRLLRR